MTNTKDRGGQEQSRARDKGVMEASGGKGQRYDEMSKLIPKGG